MGEVCARAHVCACVLRHCGLEERGAADADDAAPSTEQHCCLGNCGVMEHSRCAVIGWRGVALEVGGVSRKDSCDQRLPCIKYCYTMQ